MKSKKINIAVLAYTLSVSSPAIAGDIDIIEIEQQPAYELNTGDIFITLEAGASFSRNMTPSLTEGGPLGWDASPQGYENDLGYSSVLGAGIGYVFTPLLDVEIDVNRRNSFHYEKFQTSSATLGAKTRYFNLQNTTVMANAFLNASALCDYLVYRGPNFIVDPYVGAGLGLSVNTMTNFHSKQAASDTVFSMMSDNSINSFVYQLGAGINVRTDRGLGIGFGYRFLDAGNFQSSNYLIDNPDVGITSGVSTATWKGDLKINEIYLTLTYYLNVI